MEYEKKQSTEITESQKEELRKILEYPKEEKAMKLYEHLYGENLFECRKIILEYPDREKMSEWWLWQCNKSTVNAKFYLTRYFLAVAEIIAASHLERTSEGFSIYYNKVTFRAVGIKYADFVFFKEATDIKLPWEMAELCSRHHIVNGLTTRLLWENELEIFQQPAIKGMYKALKEIGGTHLDDRNWIAADEGRYANTLSLNEGCRYRLAPKYECFYVRPVLCCKDSEIS